MVFPLLVVHGQNLFTLAQGLFKKRHRQSHKRVVFAIKAPTRHLRLIGVTSWGLGRFAVIGEGPHVPGDVNCFHSLFVPHVGDIIVFVNFGPLGVRVLQRQPQCNTKYPSLDPGELRLKQSGKRIKGKAFHESESSKWVDVELGENTRKDLLQPTGNRLQDSKLELMRCSMGKAKETGFCAILRMRECALKLN